MNYCLLIHQSNLDKVGISLGSHMADTVRPRRRLLRSRKSCPQLRTVFLPAITALAIATTTTTAAAPALAFQQRAVVVTSTARDSLGPSSHCRRPTARRTRNRLHASQQKLLSDQVTYFAEDGNAALNSRDRTTRSVYVFYKRTTECAHTLVLRCLDRP